MIKRALPDQADLLSGIALASKAHWGYDDEFLTRFASVIGITPEYLRQNDVWVLEEAGELAGFYGLLDRGETCELDHLWLLPEFIGKGLGRVLFEHALVRAGELGARRLEWEAEPNAVGFYEQMGGRVVGETAGQLGRPLPVMARQVGA